MSALKEKLGKKIEEWRPRTTKLLKDFGDVKNIIEQLRNKKKLKKRHQAMLKRRDAFIQG